MKDINSEQLVNEDHEDIAKHAKLLSTNEGSAKLSDEEIMAQSLIFFIAGYETTASLLSFSFYALALNQNIQDILHAEIRRHFDVDKEINYDNINKMKYLNAV
ncbi:cytochrome P450-like protein 7, partial [Leptotrombidium deliense]